MVIYVICTVCLIGQCIKVWLFQGRFRWLHQVTLNLSERCIDKEYPIFRHVALLVTEISRQDQNIRIIPRTASNLQKKTSSTEAKEPKAMVSSIGEEYHANDDPTLTLTS